VINISNYAGNDNPSVGVWGDAGVGGDAGVRGNPWARGNARVRKDRVPRPSTALDWLGSLLRRWGDRWFAMNDMEAGWRGWQITRTHGGLARRYRDLRFEMLVACVQCAGAGVRADAPCGPCLGTGRVTLGEVG
jgi:hypothetical protein